MHDLAAQRLNQHAFSALNEELEWYSVKFSTVSKICPQAVALFPDFCPKIYFADSAGIQLDSIQHTRDNIAGSYHLFISLATLHCESFESLHTFRTISKLIAKRAQLFGGDVVFSGYVSSTEDA